MAPPLSNDDARFMAFEGLVQWTTATVNQSARLQEAYAEIQNAHPHGWDSRTWAHNSNTECHYFAIAAFKVLEYKNWVKELGLCALVDFSELDKFNTNDIRDLRNMREHVIDYFVGQGRAKERWFITTPEYSADASSVVNTMIGGRLDWLEFGKAAEIVLKYLLAEPIPYPASIP